MQWRRKPSSQKTVLLNKVEVIYDGFIVGYGLAYYDGEAMLKPDIVSLTGDTLPPAFYTLKFTDDPQLAVLAKNIQ
jgi:hypothetical protein